MTNQTGTKKPESPTEAGGQVKRVVMSRTTGWWEDYRCGCVSETAPRKKDLLGYCSQHGENRRYAYREIEQSSKE